MHVVSPIPANDVVTVTGVHSFTAWSISDLQGKAYLNGKIKEQDMLRIETGKLQPGTYFLRLLKNDGQQENHKLNIAR